MAGQIRKMIDKLITLRAHGNATIAECTKTKLVLKGIKPDSYTLLSEDDPTVMNKLRQIATEMNIAL